MERTGAATLRATPLQARRQAEVVEHAGHRQLRLEVRGVEPHAGGGLWYTAGAGRLAYDGPAFPDAIRFFAPRAAASRPLPEEPSADAAPAEHPWATWVQGRDTWQIASPTQPLTTRWLVADTGMLSKILNESILLC
jgi:hypothetical protein